MGLDNVNRQLNQEKISKQCINLFHVLLSVYSNQEGLFKCEFYHMFVIDKCICLLFICSTPPWISLWPCAAILLLSTSNILNVVSFLQDNFNSTTTPNWYTTTTTTTNQFKHELHREQQHRPNITSKYLLTLFSPYDTPLSCEIEISSRMHLVMSTIFCCQCRVYIKNT